MRSPSICCCQFPQITTVSRWPRFFLYFRIGMGGCPVLILKAIDLHKEWNGVSLFEQVSFEVKEGERVALFGRNGVGKTTLLQGLIGRIPFDRGTVQRLHPAEEWGWLDQQVESLHSLTVLEFVQYGSRELYQLKRTLERLENLMNSGMGMSGSTADGVVDDGPGRDASDETKLQTKFEAVMAEYGQIYDRYLQLDGFGWEVNVEKCLQLVNLEPSLWTLRFGELSGGQKKQGPIIFLNGSSPQICRVGRTDQPFGLGYAGLVRTMGPYLCRHSSVRFARPDIYRPHRHFCY